MNVMSEHTVNINFTLVTPPGSKWISKNLVIAGNLVSHNCWYDFVSVTRRKFSLIYIFFNVFRYKTWNKYCTLFIILLAEPPGRCYNFVRAGRNLRQRSFQSLSPHIASSLTPIVWLRNLCFCIPLLLPAVMVDEIFLWTILIKNCLCCA